MSDSNFTIECVDSPDRLSKPVAEIVTMCNLAYEEELDDLFDAYGPATHLIGRYQGGIVSHVMWITRWLQPDGLAPLRTAYIEMVATHPAYRGRGYASRLMHEAVGRLDGFELAALSPADTSLYRRLGWVYWHGPLFIRRDGSLLATPDERVMILPLGKTPPLDLDAGLSAEWRVGEVW